MRTGLCLLLSCLLFYNHALGQTSEELRLGETFPDLTFEGLLEPEHYDALGIPQRTGAVHLRDIRGELLILEFFNKYCLTCWRQAPQLQTFFELLEPGDLGGRVHVLSVGAGNSQEEVRAFQQEFELSYPLAPDPGFEQFYRLDPGGAPWTAFLLRDREGWVLADSHVGFYGDIELLARARTLLKGWSAGGAGEGALSLSESAAGDPESQVQRFARELIDNPVQTRPRDLEDGTRVYEVTAAHQPDLRLYVRAAQREPVCDLCHPIRFLFAFDDEGVVRGFAPLFVTKFGNEPWDEEDREAFRSRLLGRTLHDLHFDPEVDAVTSATMSSALIFAEVRRMSEILRELNR